MHNSDNYIIYYWLFIYRNKELKNILDKKVDYTLNKGFVKEINIKKENINGNIIHNLLYREWKEIIILKNNIWKNIYII